jgi:dipeptidase
MKIARAEKDQAKITRPRKSDALRNKIRRFTREGFFLLILLSVASFSASVPTHCSTVIVGRLASSDGSVLLAHNEDLDPPAAQHLIRVPHLRHSPDEIIALWSGARIPQVSETFAYFGTKIFDKAFVPGDIVSGINEYQVAVANNLAVQRNSASDLKENRMIWTEFTQIALERAKTAREAVRIIGECARLYKLALDPGTMFGIIDPKEGWWLEVTQDGPWVAQRVPDQGYAMRANAYRIGVVDFNDPQNFLFSPDLVSHAVGKGWFNPSAGAAFNFTKAYAMKSDADSDYNTHRQERADQLLAPRLPKISVNDLVHLLRDHYEGTPWDLSGGPDAVSPHNTRERTLCCKRTIASVVIQARGWLPAEIGGVFRVAMSPPCASPYIPWYFGSKRIPAPYQAGQNMSSPDSAYWAFQSLSNLAEKNYQKRIPVIQDRWNALEKEAELSQSFFEGLARCLDLVSKSLAVDLLNCYSEFLALQAFNTAGELAKEIE